MAEALQGVRRVFLDTAPVIYYVERNQAYTARVDQVFDRLDAGTLLGSTSPVTLAECLIAPVRLGALQVQRNFRDLIVGGPGVIFVALDSATAQRAAELRARYNLTLTDAFQIAAALAGDCDAFLTNDADLKRVQEIRILVVGELEE